MKQSMRGTVRHCHAALQVQRMQRIQGEHLKPYDARAVAPVFIHPSAESRLDMKCLDAGAGVKSLGPPECRVLNQSLPYALGLRRDFDLHLHLLDCGCHSLS